jgi:uncharacterized protein with GYD domain
MYRYLILLNFTDRGIRDVRDSCQRAAKFASETLAAEGKIVAQFWMLGEYDGCIIFEVPSQTVASALLLGLASAGNVRTKSMQLFDAEEFASILGKL